MDIEIPPEFIIFCDMDGTLIETDYANYLSYKCAVIKATSGKNDIEFSDERINRENLKKRLPSLTDAQCDVIACLKVEYFTKFLSKTILNTALANLLSLYCGRNKIILVTYCREKRAIETLKYHKLIGYFTQLIYWESLPQGELSNKYLNALRLTEANPKTVLVFENDKSDAEKAVLAGIPRKNIFDNSLRLKWKLHD